MEVGVLEGRVDKVRKKMEEKGLPALLVSHLPNIFYLSGFSGSSAWLLLTAKKALLYTDFRYIEQARSEAPSFEIMKLDTTVDNALFKQLAGFLKGEQTTALAVEEAYLTLGEFNRLQGVEPHMEVMPCSNVVEEIRSVKEEGEIESIRFAARIADRALSETLPLLKPGMSELEFAAELEYRLRRNGAAGTAFTTIVASGPRSALPHGIAGSRIIGGGEFIVVDFGAIWEGYCSDMTRTFLLGEPTARQEHLYKLVCNAREIALQSLSVGMQGAEVDGAARRYLQEEGYGDAFGHGLGHGVGVEVHEQPTLSPRGKSTLQSNMVFSVEPGIYLGDAGGVRVEDLVVLRPHGPEIITGSGRDLVV